MLSAHHDLVGTKGNKLGGGCCGWRLCLPFLKKICILSSILQILFHCGHVFYLEIGGVSKNISYLATHLSDVAGEGGADQTLTWLQAGWLVTIPGKRYPAWLSCCVPSCVPALDSMESPIRRDLIGGKKDTGQQTGSYEKPPRWYTQWAYKLT